MNTNLEELLVLEVRILQLLVCSEFPLELFILDSEVVDDAPELFGAAVVRAEVQQTCPQS